MKTLAAIFLTLIVISSSIIFISEKKDCDERRSIANQALEKSQQVYAYSSVVCKFNVHARTNEGLALEYNVTAIIETPMFYTGDKLMYMVNKLRHVFIITHSKMVIKDHHDLPNNYENELKLKGIILQDVAIEPTAESTKLIQSVLQPELTN